MTAPTQRAHAAARLAEATVHSAVRRVVALVLVVVAVRYTVGVWPAAVLGGVALTAELVGLLAAIDPRTTDRRATQRRPTVPVPARPPVGERGPRAAGVLPGLDGRHVEFARSLAGVADWYLTECEREAQR